MRRARTKSRLDSGEIQPFDPLAILGSLLTMGAYAVCFALPRFSVSSVNANVFGGVFLGYLAAALNSWVFLRRGRFHEDSIKLAAWNFFWCLPFTCCGWGALAH